MTNPTGSYRGEHHDQVPRFPSDDGGEFPDADHRDADLTFGGCGDIDCPTGETVVEV